MTAAAVARRNIPILIRVSPTVYGGISRSPALAAADMAIDRLMQNYTMEPEEIRHIKEAYDQVLHSLCVKDRDPLTEIIAKKIAQTGIKDPAQLSALAIKELEVR
jgi:hypothetical protein